MKKILIAICIMLCSCASVDTVKIPDKINLESICKEMSIKKNSEVVIDNSEILGKGSNKKIEITGLSIYDVVSISFGDVLNVPYVIDTSLVDCEKSIDINVSQIMRKDEFYKVVKNALQLIGIEVMEDRGVYYISLKDMLNDTIDQDIKSNVYIETVVNQNASDILKNIDNIVKQISSSIILYADDNKNLITVVSSSEYIDKVKRLIHIYDVPQKQIFIETMIIESTETSDTKNGLMFYLQNTVEGFSSLFGIDLVPDTRAIQYSIINDTNKFKILLSYLNQIGMVNMVSNPYLVVQNNTVAKLNIGTDVPILLSIDDETDDDDKNEVTYRKTGVVLNIHPVIIGNKVKMKVYVESSQAQVNNTSLISSPTILTRSVNTNMTLQDNTAFIIGGIREKVISKSVSGIPLKNQLASEIINYNEKGTSSVEMLIMVRAYIIDTNNDYVNIDTYLRGNSHVN